MHIALAIDWVKQDILALVASISQQEALSHAERWAQDYLETPKESVTVDHTGCYTEKIDEGGISVFCINLNEQTSSVLPCSKQDSRLDA